MERAEGGQDVYINGSSGLCRKNGSLISTGRYMNGSSMSMGRQKGLCHCNGSLLSMGN